MIKVRSTWSEALIAKRNSIEHDGWILPDIPYKLCEPTRVNMIEPTIDGLQISEYVKINGNRVISFVEDLTVYSFSKIINPVTIVEIPESEREDDFPKRFKLDLLRSEITKWNLGYTEGDFV